MASNYPPGVTGNEPEIVGYDDDELIDDDADLIERELSRRAEAEAEAAYFAKLEQGMCPHCESFDTAPVEMMYAAVATRYCRACGRDYVAEW